MVLFLFPIQVSMVGILILSASSIIVETEEDFNVIQSLKETINKQRGQIKGLQTEVKHKESEVNTVSRELLVRVKLSIINSPSLRSHFSHHFTLKLLLYLPR